ncbi:E3 ubiquitin-protein ligase marchf11, partial [Characodon lateralis]|nr:E3 ubiquitin-protein ligase marchf11 [Characodon lateralis]
VTFVSLSGLQGDLLNPCRCDGSVRYTHQQCLLKWISERGCWTCELCCYRFQVIAINMKRPWQWQSITITLVEKVQIIAVFLGSLFLVASISWLLWSALSPQAIWQRRDVLFQICYGMYGFMDLVCVGLIVHEGAAVYNVFMRWRAVNLHWDVQSYNKAKDMEETSTGHSSLGPRTLWLPLATLGPSGPLHPTQLGSRPWTCLCLAPFCPGLVPRNNLSQDADSGEVVIRVTSV